MLTSQHVTNVRSMYVMDVSARARDHDLFMWLFKIIKLRIKVRIIFIFTSRLVPFYGCCFKYVVVILVCTFLTVDNGITCRKLTFK